MASISPLTHKFAMKVEQQTQLNLREVTNLKEFGQFWQPIDLNSSITPADINVKVGDNLIMTLDAGIFGPMANSRVILSTLFMFFEVPQGKEAGSPPLKVEGFSEPFEMGSGFLPVVTQPILLTQSTIDFKFGVLPLPHGVDEKIFNFRVSGYLAVTPLNRGLPLESLGNTLLITFDPQMRVSTGPHILDGKLQRNRRGSLNKPGVGN